MTTELVLIAFAILIPITPAYILYRALPSTSNVEGPFQGLKIRLSGAFGGYFLLVLLIFGFHYSQPKNQYEVWEVQGQLQPENGAVEKSRLSLHPDTVKVSSDGRFKVLVATMPGINGGLRFPELHIEHPNYQSVDIDLNESEPGYGQQTCHISKSQSDKALKLDNVVILKDRGPAYDQSSQKSQVAEPVSPSDSEVKR